MSFDSDPECRLNVYGGLLVENTGGMRNTGLADSMMRQRLYDQLAGHLAADAVTVTETPYTREHRLQVYVLTSAQLEKYVQRRAEKLHPSIPSVRWEEYGTTGGATHA